MPRRKKIHGNISLTKVFIVTAGEYSDYHIVGVFNDKSLAESFIKLTNLKEDYICRDVKIEEYPINKEKDISNLKYHIWMDFIYYSGSCIYDDH